MNHFVAQKANVDAKMFRVVVLTLSLVAVTFSLTDFLSRGNTRDSIVHVVMLAAVLTAFAAMRAQRPRLAFLILGWGAWGGITVQAVLSGSIDHAVLYTYPVVMLLSGWLLGVRHSVAMGLASMAVFFALAWMQTVDISFVPVLRAPWGRAIDFSAILLIGMVVLHQVLRYQQTQGAEMVALNAQLTQTVADLTARQNQLSQAESRFEKVGNMIPAPLLLTDWETGRILYVNRAWEARLGWPVQEVLGKSPLEIGVWFDEAARDTYAAEFRRSGCVRNLEMNARARDGRLLPVSISADALEQDGRRITMNLLFDLSERKRVEARMLESNAELGERVALRTLELKSANDELSAALSTLRRAQAEFVQSEKLAALGSLVAGVAHELNTPIGNALVVASALHGRAIEFQGQVSRNELKRSALDRFMVDSLEGTELMQRSLQRASELLHSFKQVAVDQSSERQRVFELQEVIQEVIATLSPNLKKMPWRIDIDIPPGITLDSFPGPLEQVTINLIMNAAIHAFVGRTQGRISVRGRQRDAQTVELVFADDGVGIPDELIGRIFEPFFTTRLGQGGAGLGLTLVHQIVTKVLHGKVSVESTPQGGTRFMLLLARSISSPDPESAGLDPLPAP